MEIEKHLQEIEIPEVRSPKHKQELWEKLVKQSNERKSFKWFGNRKLAWSLASFILCLAVIIPLAMRPFTTITVASLLDKSAQQMTAISSNYRYLYTEVEKQYGDANIYLLQTVVDRTTGNRMTVIKEKTTGTVVSIEGFDENGRSLSCSNCVIPDDFNFSVNNYYANVSDFVVKSANVASIFDEVNTYFYTFKSEDPTFLKEKFDLLKNIEGIKYVGEDKVNGERAYVLEMDSYWKNEINILDSWSGIDNVFKLPSKTKVFLNANTYQIMKVVISSENKKVPTIATTYLKREFLETKPEINIGNAKIVTEEPAENYELGGPEVSFDRTIVSESGFINPISDESCKGSKFNRGWTTYHTGLDYSKEDGCWISSIGDGVVQSARWCEGGLGFCIVIKHDNGISSLYGHGNGTFAVSEGERVKRGDKIMYMGNTGNSFGTHIHFSISKEGSDIMQHNDRINPDGIVPM